MDRGRNGRRRRIVLLLVVCLMSAAVGLLVSQVLGAPLGEDHGCSAGATSAAACHYPPQSLRWAVEWTIGGLAVGIVLGITLSVLRPSSPPEPGRRHLLRG